MKGKLLNLSNKHKLAILALLMGFVALLIGDPGSNNKISVNAKELALSTVKESDKLNVTSLADWIIKEKGDYTLVDLRSEKEFTSYNLPNSKNIALGDLLSSELKRNEKIILYGDDDISAAQGWFILKSSDYKGVYILSGGMNAWKNEILFPKLAANATPEQNLASEKIKQVSLHFGGSPQIVNGESTSAIIPQQTVQTLPKITAPAGGSSKGAVKKKKEGC